MWLNEENFFLFILMTIVSHAGYNGNPFFQYICKDVFVSSFNRAVLMSIWNCAASVAIQS